MQMVSVDKNTAAPENAGAAQHKAAVFRRG